MMTEDTDMAAKILGIHHLRGDSIDSGLAGDLEDPNQSRIGVYTLQSHGPKIEPNDDNIPISDWASLMAIAQFYASGILYL